MDADHAGIERRGFSRFDLDIRPNEIPEGHGKARWRKRNAAIRCEKLRDDLVGFGVEHFMALEVRILDFENARLKCGRFSSPDFYAHPEPLGKSDIVNAGRKLDDRPKRIDVVDLLPRAWANNVDPLSGGGVDDAVPVLSGSLDLQPSRPWAGDHDLRRDRLGRFPGFLRSFPQHSLEFAPSRGVKIGAACHIGDALQLKPGGSIHS